jgi:hypothetical protein
MIGKKRLGIFVGGVVATLYGWGMLRRGVFVYHNSYSVPIYLPAWLQLDY